MGSPWDCKESDMTEQLSLSVHFHFDAGRYSIWYAAAAAAAKSL